VPRHEQYVPRHRNARNEPALKKGIRKSVVFSGIAVAATGIAISSGIVHQDNPSVDASAASLSGGTPTHSAGVAATGASRSGDRTQGVSRSGDRTPLSQVKKKVLDQGSGGQVTKTADLSSTDPRDVAKALLPEFGFSEAEFSCLDSLYNSESGWDIHADNPSSSAYGIPQALPGSKMASAGPDWESNPATQIRWGLEYIQSSYGTPCSAWSFKQSHNWY
jgi:hypothetical protein